MPAVETTIVGAPCWADLMTADAEGAKRFYGTVFGWEASEPQEQFGGYFNFTKAGVPVAGGMTKMQAELPDLWSVYLSTEDAKQTVDKAAAAGSTTVVEAMDVATLGTMAVVIDPGGAAIGMWQPGEHKGFGLVREHGTPGWFELHTREYDASLAYYRDVFGWTTQTVGDTDEFRYTVLQHGEEQLAGIMDASNFMPADAAAAWSVYFAVDDTDATLETIGRLGGATVMPAEDTPYGRLAVATDPSGAQFKLVGPNDAMPG
jgi:predicted enzyme related to lactoylglutathione lyase